MSILERERWLDECGDERDGDLEVEAGEDFREALEQIAGMGGLEAEFATGALEQDDIDERRAALVRLTGYESGQAGWVAFGALRRHP